MQKSKLVLTKCNNCIVSRKFSRTAANSLRFVQFVHKHNPREIKVGCLIGYDVVDLNAECREMPRTMLDFIRGGEPWKKFVYDMVTTVGVSHKTCIGNVNLLPPVHGMDKVFGVGTNYIDHCMTHKLKPPKVPMIFSKFASSVIGPYDCIRVRTNITQKVDYEVELCIVIGEVTSNVPSACAYQYVFGCTVGQDISARDWQKDLNGGQFLLGKSMDTFCPIGPCIVTMDEINNPECLNIICKVNGEIRQEGNTNQHIHRIPDIISRLSSVMTLYPGDLILTGTPAGVGVYQNKFLKPGDVLYSAIENIGCMQNIIVNYC